MTRKLKTKSNASIATKAKGAGPISLNLLQRIAILGDSGVALLGSFFLLLVAMAVSWYTDLPAPLDDPSPVKDQHHHSHNNIIKDASTNFDDLYKQLGPVPEMKPARVFSIEEGDSIEDIHLAYKLDGVVAVRGLIAPALLERLDKASRTLIEKESNKQLGAPSRRQKKRDKQFHTMQQHPIFLDTPDFNVNAGNDTETGISNLSHANPFLEVALLSNVPIFASQLMLPELKTGENVRMLRDIFLAKDKEEFICGWHVDDFGFWPATASSPGINAWIALDEMPPVSGGGFALAVGSHNASWRQEAHFVTGATTTYPANGFHSAADMFANRPGSGTCNIQTAAPHLFKRMEETKRIYDLRRGDIIFHQRWLFHRTVAFERDHVTDDSPIYRRYTVRYAPGSAVIPPGWGTELSVLWDEKNGNRTADEISENDGPWYPMVWPSPNVKELNNLKDLVENKLPIARERKLAREKEMVHIHHDYPSTPNTRATHPLVLDPPDDYLAPPRSTTAHRGDLVIHGL